MTIHAKETANDFYPVYNAVKGPARRVTVFNPEDLPVWQRYWFGLLKEKKGMGIGTKSVDNMAFVAMCRDLFNVLEPVTRCKKHIDVPVSLSLIHI